MVCLRCNSAKLRGVSMKGKNDKINLNSGNLRSFKISFFKALRIMFLKNLLLSIIKIHKV